MTTCSSLTREIPRRLHPRSFGEQSLSILKKHVSLYNYGLDVMAANNAVLTPYGLVQRRDGNELLQSQEHPSERSGMEMMQ